MLDWLPQRLRFEKTETPGEEYIRQQFSQHTRCPRSTAQNIGVTFYKKVKVENKYFESELFKEFSISCSLNCAKDMGVKIPVGHLKLLIGRITYNDL